MKFKVLKTFSFNETKYEEGDVADLPDHVTENFCGRGYGKKDYEEKQESKSSYEFLSKKEKKKKEKNY